MKKKGVSGLIVAVLLVAVSLTIGGLVIGWISGYTSDSLDTSTQAQKEQDDCNDIDWKLVTVRIDKTDATSTDTVHNISITVENKNEEDIKGFLFKYIPASGTELIASKNVSTSDALTTYGRKTFNNTFNTTDLTYIEKVEIAPVIDVIVDSTIETVCTSAKKEVEYQNFA